MTDYHGDYGNWEVDVNEPGTAIDIESVTFGVDGVETFVTGMAVEAARELGLALLAKCDQFERRLGNGMC